MTRARAGRVGVAGLLLGALLGTSLVSAAPGLAGPPPPPAATVSVMIGSPQIYGYAGSSAHSMTLRQKRNGTVIATKTFTTESDGFFAVRLKPVKIGDQIAIQYLGTRTMTVPKVTLTANASTNRIAGHLPQAGEAEVQIADVIGTFSKGGTTQTFTTDANGDFSGTHPGLTGADRLELRWYSAPGDAIGVELRLAAAQVEVGSAKVWLFGRNGAKVKADLLAPNGTVRGTATATLPTTTTIGQGTFRKNGTAVKVKAGDRVRIGGNVGLVVRTPNLTATATTLSATCFPNQEWIAGTIFGAGAFSYVADGTANGSGAVNGSWVSPLSAGTKLRLMCENAAGYDQDMTITLQ